VAGQKAAEAASAAAQGASTLPAAPRAALAKQNGQGDGGHLSSGLLQVRACAARAVGLRLWSAAARASSGTGRHGASDNTIR
jgi:hypothetical protein